MEREVVSPVIIPRNCFFDTLKKRAKGRGKKKELSFEYAGVKVRIERTELTVSHEKLFYSILRTSRKEKLVLGNKVWSNVFITDFYTLKKVAGFRKDMGFEDLEDLVKDLSGVKIEIRRKDNGKLLYLLTSLIKSVKVIGREGKREKIVLGIEIDEEVLRLIEKSITFTMPVELLREINSIENPYVYKVVMYYMTQTSRQKNEFFSLLERLAGRKFKRYERSKIKKKVLEEEKTLKEYGIFLVEDDGKLYFLYRSKHPQVFVDFKKSSPS